MFIPFVLPTSCVVIDSPAQFHPLNPTDRDRALIRPESTEQLPEMNPRLVKRWLEHRLGAPAYRWLWSEFVAVEPTGEVKADYDRYVKERVGRLDEMVKDWIANRPPSQEFHEPWQDRVLEELPQLSRAEIVLASRLEEKDAFALSASLSHLTGRKLAHWIFGIGVVGMTLSSITLLMLISGFVICEMLGLPPKGWPNRLGCLAATTGVLGPFLWTEHARFWLVVPTSVFCFTLLPFAYLTFVFVMNSKSLLGDEMPRGGRRVAWNLGMGLAASVATVAAVYMVWVKSKSWFLANWNWPYGGYVGLGVVAALALLVVAVHFMFPRNSAKSE